MMALRIILASLFLTLLFVYTAQDSFAQTPPAPCPNGQQIAFPGAEGFGRCAQGGRGGQVIEVTNLNDSGSGSLRACVQAVGPRICVFRVSGTITLGSDLSIQNPFLTIAGQTAPGGGIALRGSGIEVDAAHVIIRHIRVRVGSLKPNWSGIRVNKNNVTIDHCSVSWVTDDTMTAWTGGAADITFQWNILSESLGKQGMLIGGGRAGDTATRVSAHHNLFAHNPIRAPEITAGDLDMVNNVIYDQVVGESRINPFYAPIRANFVGNYYKDGPSENHSGTGQIWTWADRPFGSSSSLHVQGNIGPSRPTNAAPESAIVTQNNGAIPLVSRFSYPTVTTADAFTARDQVLAGAGATLPARDSVDIRVVNEVTNGTGRRISDPSEVGGWPVLVSGTAPQDSDHDGMPDTWELAEHLNPNNPSDGALLASNGYTNLENYLNELAGAPVIAGTPPPRPTGLTVR